MLVRMLHVVAMLAAANVSKESLRSYGKGVIWQSHCVRCSMSRNRVFRHWTFRKMLVKEASLKQHTHWWLSFPKHSVPPGRFTWASAKPSSFASTAKSRDQDCSVHMCAPSQPSEQNARPCLFCSMLKASKGYRLYLCHLMPHVNLKSSKLIWKLVCVYIRSAVGSSWKSRDMQLSYRCGQRMVKRKFQDRLMIN